MQTQFRRRDGGAYEGRRGELRLAVLGNVRIDDNLSSSRDGWTDVFARSRSGGFLLAAGLLPSHFAPILSSCTRAEP